MPPFPGLGGCWEHGALLCFQECFTPPATGVVQPKCLQDRSSSSLHELPDLGADWADVPRGEVEARPPPPPPAPPEPAAAPMTPTGSGGQASELSKSTEDRLKDLPMCPMVGCSYAFLKDFAESEGKALFDSISEAKSSRMSGRVTAALVEQLAQWARGGKLRNIFRGRPPEDLAAPKRVQPIDDEGFNMGTVCNNIIKPRTRVDRTRNVFETAGSSTALGGAPDRGCRSRCSKAAKQPPATAGAGGGVARPSLAPSGSLASLGGDAAKQEALSYAELGLRSGFLDSRGKPAFAKATHFVSHAWKCSFRGFVEALGFWLEQSGTDEDTAYFWVDAFVVNQHQTQEYPQEWWSTRFMQAIGDIGDTVLVLEPWQQPVPLTRAWVIWELYCTTVCGARLHLAMSRDTLEEFKAALLDSFERVQTAMSHVDVSKSDAFHEHDRAMIHAEIQRTIGFTRMNEVVQTRMLQWLIDYVKGQLDLLKVRKFTTRISKPRQATQSLAVVDQTAHFRLKENLGRLLRESGRSLEAEDLLLELLTEVEDAFGKDHMISLSCLNQLAVTVQKLGKEEEALKLHRDCLQRRRRVLGAGHEDTLQSTSNLAVLLGGRKRLTLEQFDEARQLYSEAISGREASAGPDHPRTLYTVSNLGKLLSTAPQLSEGLFEEAEALHDRAVSGLTRGLHEAHPLTLAAMHNQACHWLACSAFQDIAEEAQEPSAPRSTGDGAGGMQEKAISQLRRVRNLRTEKLGKDHPDTVLTERTLASPELVAQEVRSRSEGSQFSSMTS